MTYNVLVIRLNIHEAKTHLSKYLARLKPGETILLCNRNVPVAEIRALPKEGRKPRPFGLAKGTMHISPEFFDPLPDEMLKAFEGSGP